MSEANPAPAAGNDAPLSFDDGVDALTDVLKDPETDLSEEDQDQGGEQNEADAEGDPEAEVETETSDEETAEEETDGPGYESGKFAADTANVRLKDGTVISVQDLKRGYLSQASFTRGTQENAKEREALASQRAETEQYARTLQEHRDFLLQASKQFIPQAPDRSLLDQNSASFDPVRYWSMKADYDEKISALSQLQQMTQSEQDRAAKEQERQLRELRAAESKKLLEDMPELAKPEVYNKFWAEAVETMADYGFSAEDLNGLSDHRFYKAMRDLAAYRRARSRLPAVKQAIQSKPVLSGKRRMDTKDKSSRESQARAAQLRRTGSFDDGVRSLMDIPDL